METSRRASSRKNAEGPDFGSEDSAPREPKAGRLNRSFGGERIFVRGKTSRVSRGKAQWD